MVLYTSVTNSRYLTTAGLLRTRIAVEALASGTLPTEHEMCAEYNVSRTTLRKALALLQAEGWIEARQGSGWSVALDRRGRQFGALRLRVTADGRTDASSTTLGHKRRRPADSVARDLRADRRRALLLVEHLTVCDGIPIHRSETWFNETLSTIMDPAEIVAVPPARLLASLGYSFGPFDQYAEAVLSNDRDSETLNIELRVAVLQIVRTAYDPQGRPLFQSIHRHPGHAVRLDVDLPTTNQTDGLVVTIQHTPPSQSRQQYAPTT